MCTTVTKMDRPFKAECKKYLSFLLLLVSNMQQELKRAFWSDYKHICCYIEEYQLVFIVATDLICDQ